MTEPLYAPDPKRARRARRDRSTHFVYECYDVFGAPLYVGCTSSIAQRFGTHAGRDWWPYVHTIKMTSYDNKDTAAMAELDLIHTLTPRHNIQGLTHEQLQARA